MCDAVGIAGQACAGSWKCRRSSARHHVAGTMAPHLSPGLSSERCVLSTRSVVGLLVTGHLLLSWIFWRLPQEPARTWRKTGHRAAARVRLALIPRLSLSGEGLVAGVAPHGVCIHSPHPLSTCCSDNCRSVCEQARFGEEPLGRWISLWITLWIGEGRVVDYCRCRAAGDGPLRVFMIFK